MKKSEHQDSAVKTEKDWLSLPKNIPKENISLYDPNVHPRLIHKDGSICHSKSYWKSLNKKPPLKEFKLPDLFSDEEELEMKREQTEGTTKSNITTGKKGRETTKAKKMKTTIEVPFTKGSNTPMSDVTSENVTKGESDRNNNTPENSVNTDNAENSGDHRTPLPSKSPALNTDTSEKIEKSTNVELHERSTTSPSSMIVDTEKTNNHENSRSSDCTSVSELNTTTDKTEGNDTSKNDMTVNTEKKTNIHENVTNESLLIVTTEKTNVHSIGSDVTSNAEHKVTTEAREERNTTYETNTQDKETSVNNQTRSNQPKKSDPNEDWASLMFHSDDSLFEEMSKQLENNHDRSEPIIKEPSSTATQNFETLPDVVITQNKTEAAKGLLMLNLNLNDVDAEIDNE